ncbi:hypothetical protein M2137_000590 [Parabacteroides sp. PFB2-10]|uniref:ISAon1 family transposase N-terminal region protein n=1 Tax=Parabacteroides sp. PFB2-10 TaxID=1742405 RepID=UPI002473FB8E|nr:transposase family protein [Parabacteroides sp. PFB2-10]MDH6311831.1 hypothetical protein [Parabacteroides sp. PFB2-10]MDL2245368.1 transposase family protein [Parabacteroides sp. OttesenSCG-928-J18]
MDIYKSLARLFLPDEVLDYFDVVNFEEIHTGKTFFGDYPEKELHLYLDEKDMPPCGSKKYRPNGFTEEKVMHDFPIRDRKAILHIRRRRWINAEGHNEVLDYGDLLGADGTKFSREFAAFLKECP